MPGGVVEADGRAIEDPAATQLQHDELDDTGMFCTWEEAESRMPANTAGRIPAAQAREGERTIYLPNGR